MIMETGSHDGHRKRLRERYLNAGPEAFQPHEMMELLLSYAIPRKDTNELAHRLLKEFRSLKAVLEAPVEQLAKVDGIGESAAILINMMLPLWRAYQSEMLKAASAVTYTSPQKMMEYCVKQLTGERDEVFLLLSFDSRLRLIAEDRLERGTPDQVSILPRKVLTTLINRSATGAVLVHNHPSGNLTPSQADLDVTERIRRVLESVDIRLLDHIITGYQESISLRNEGYIR